MQCQKHSVMCGVCFGDYNQNTQVALHLAAEKMSLLHMSTRSHIAAVDELLSTSRASSVVSVQAVAAAVQEVEGAPIVVDCVMTTEQIAASYAARMP